jgi:nucleoside-diphosphate-sugar epimerase
VREVLGDVADRDVVRRAASGQDAVLHLAAKVDVTGPWAEYVSANIEGTRNVVEACRSGGVSRLVHVSSPSVAHGGRALVGLGAEPADPASARGHYSRSKAVAEVAALTADSPALAVLVVRPHLVWGPGDTQLVARVVERAKAGRLPAIGSGTALMDTTYVDNAAEAMVAAVDACGQGPRRGTRGLQRRTASDPRDPAAGVSRGRRAGTGRSVPFAAAWLAGAAVEGIWTISRRRDLPPLNRFMAEQLATAHWFDQRRTRAALGWAPRVGLDEGFTRLADWYASTA